MEQLWQATMDEFGDAMYSFEQIPNWLRSAAWSGVFIYKNACILFLFKRLQARRDIVVHNIISREYGKGYATAAILRLTIEASYVNGTVCIENIMNPASQALATRLIRDYGFTNTPNNSDELKLLMGEYLNTSNVYSPLRIGKYIRRYHDYLYTGEEPPLKRLRTRY